MKNTNPHPAHLNPDEVERLDSEHAQELNRRAELAGRSVIRLFGKKVMGIPGTLVGSVQIPETRTLGKRFADWHYWWQAHFLDCALDAAAREHRLHNSSGAYEWFETAQKILRGIKTRNFNVFTNAFYDDMAWLALAAGRLNDLSLTLRGRPDSLASDAGRALFAALAKGATDDLGGGMFWSARHDFKNTPATAPAALAFVRGQQPQRAAGLLNWLDSSLWSGEESAYLDGLKVKDGAISLERGLFSYNQGPVLAALLEVVEAGGELRCDVSERLSALFEGIDRHFTSEFTVASSGEKLTVLRTQAGGDGGLFTGILARYLAYVARSPQAPADLRERARELVLNTAEILWEGRREFDPDLPLNEMGIDVNEIRGEAAVLFSTSSTLHSSETLKPGAPVELSSQLQAWMILEAAATL
ncbi:glycoside hydrolase family 76 protein [Rothia aerolata]|uniref:Glycosyl hydrolase n=1 Tax=Rothia aerolata TaxID=1812262 RepID=A0A917IUY9_9MICC|nr:glycoside hydrolase family 76 protein [Rothia aerolata]GGH65302.1 glycosyl hydrolase [Rothia aerolata]